MRVKATTWASAAWSDIENPTNDITFTKESNWQQHRLYDGSLARTIPNGTSVNYGTTTIEWSFVSAVSTVLTKVNTSMDSGYEVEFKTHDLDSGGTYQYISGYIMTRPQVYKLGLFPTPSGVYKTMYDVTIDLDIKTIASSAQTD